MKKANSLAASLGKTLNGMDNRFVYSEPLYTKKGRAYSTPEIFKSSVNLFQIMLRFRYSFICQGTATEDSEGTFSVFDSSCHQLLPV